MNATQTRWHQNMGRRPYTTLLDYADGGEIYLVTLVTVTHNCHVCISKTVSELSKIFPTEVQNL